MPVFGSKDKNVDLACNFAYVDGIQGWCNYDYPAPVCVTQEDLGQRLAIIRRLSKIPPKYLPYNRIVSVGVVSKKEITKQRKSVFWRAAVGSFLLGPLGAVIGGLSGIGNKKKTKYRNFFIINYRPVDSLDEIKVIFLEIVGASLHWNKFLKELQQKFLLNRNRKHPNIFNTL